MGKPCSRGANLKLTPDTQFLLTARGGLFPQWQAQAEITAVSAQLGDLMQALSLYSYADLGNLFRAAHPGNCSRSAHQFPWVMPMAPCWPRQTLARALQALAQIQADQQAAVLLPDLNQLDGSISGRFRLALSQQDGIAADFDLTGQNWIWGRYRLFGNQFIARGLYGDQTLSLNPVEFRASDTRLSLAGDVSPQRIPT